MSNDFAKVFGSGYQQLLVQIGTSEEDSGPEISVSMRAKDGAVVATIKLGGWPNDDAGWAKAQRGFDMIEEKTAYRALMSTLDDLGIADEFDFPEHFK